MFVGFVQEPYGAPCTRIRKPETPSLSLHSSPSSVLGSLGSCSPSNPSSPINNAEPGVQVSKVDEGGNEEASCKVEQGAPSAEQNQSGNTGNHSQNQDKVSLAESPISEVDLEHSGELTEEDTPCHNNNKDSGREIKERQSYRVRRGDGEWPATQTMC